MIEFVLAALELSIMSYVWMPPDSGEIRVDTRNPVCQTERGWKEVSALYAWADRTDPGSVKRTAFYKRVWNERAPGQEIVMVDKLTCGTALQMSL